MQNKPIRKVSKPNDIKDTAPHQLKIGLILSATNTTVPAYNPAINPTT